MVENYLIRKRLFVSFRFVKQWKFWLSICVPIICLPVLSATSMSPEGRCGYILLVITIFWVLNLIPLPMSSLMPFFLCPMLGILSSDEVTRGFLKEISILLFGGMAAAIGIEQANLHNRIALRVLLTLGTAPRWLLLGFMVSSGFLSMWINNTSACALMLPIAESLLAEMYPSAEELVALGVFDPATEDLRQKEHVQIRRMILTSIAMSCNLGGTGTVTGTGPNVVLLGVLVQQFGDDFYISYLQWMEFAVPVLILSIVVAWFSLQIFFMGLVKTFTKDVVTTSGARIKPILRRKYDSLGKCSFHEQVIFVLFVVLVLLWMTRDPRITKNWAYGWKFLFYKQKEIRDSAAAILIVVIMAMVPSMPFRFFHRLHDRQLDDPPLAALEWTMVQKNLGWGVLLIMGGGLSLSDACKSSGLSAWLAKQLQTVEDAVARPLLSLFCLAIVLCMTTLTSNTATSAIILPVLVPVASGMSINPIYFMLPAAIVCSYSFLLPISTPPNTMVYDKGGIRVIDMLIPGIMVSVILVLLLLAEMEFYAPLIFDMDKNATILKE